MPHNRRSTSQNKTHKKNISTRLIATITSPLQQPLSNIFVRVTSFFSTPQMNVKRHPSRGKSQQYAPKRPTREPRNATTRSRQSAPQRKQQQTLYTARPTHRHPAKNQTSSSPQSPSFFGQSQRVLSFLNPFKGIPQR